MHITNILCLFFLLFINDYKTANEAPGTSSAGTKHRPKPFKESHLTLFFQTDNLSRTINAFLSANATIQSFSF